MKRILLILNAILLAVCSYAQGEYSATPSVFGNNFVLKGKSIRVPITITNTGTKAISNVTYTLTRDGEEVASRKVAVSISSEKTGTINLLFKADSVARRSPCTFTITKVNNKDNEASESTIKGNVITILEKPVVVPVIEEFTGTWCGWCPVGFDGVESAAEAYGDRAALIAIHCSDVMDCGKFSAITNKISGYPSAIVDSQDGDFYPTAGNVKSMIEQQIQNKMAAASIQVKAEWSSAAQKIINITTSTKFVYSDDEANYGIAYVLTEDGMHGTGSSWAQTNNLSGNSSYASSNPFWYKSPSKVTGLNFNHVGVAAWNLDKGVNGSVPTSVVAGEELKYTYKANISSNTLIQDKSNLKVIVMLIDRANGNVVNAAQTTIEDYTTGIIETPSPVPSRNAAEVYDLNGRKVSAPQRGINIIRMPDGTVKKVMRK